MTTAALPERAASKITESSAETSPSSSTCAAITPVLALQPDGEGRRQLRIDPDCARQKIGRPRRTHWLCRDVGMVQPPRGIQKAGRDVVGFQIWKIGDDLLVRFPSGQQLQHIDDAYPHATNARATAALFGANRDSPEQFSSRHNGPREWSVKSYHDSRGQDTPSDSRPPHHHAARAPLPRSRSSTRPP